MFVTTKKDFEQEIIDFAFQRDCLDVIGEIYLGIAPNQNVRRLQPNLLDKKIRGHYGLVKDEILYSLVYCDCDTNDEWLFFLLTWFSKHKSIMLGKIIGDKLPERLIPDVYKQTILKAVALARNV